MRVNGRVIALSLLLVVLAAVVVYELGQWTTPPPPGGAPTAGGVPTPVRRGPTAAAPMVPAVRLDALEAARKEPAPNAARNLFQFQPKPAPPPPPAPVMPVQPVVPAGPPLPPPPPPILLKFIGIVQAPDQKLAVLTDSATKDVFYGREGDIIDGRYRILRIGVESVEMAYVDGRGRQTIRLTGS